MGYISSGPIELCMIMFLRWSQTRFSLTVGRSLLPQSLLSDPSPQKVKEERLPVKTEAKGCWAPQPSPHPLLPVFCVACQNGYTFSDLPILVNILVEAFVIHCMPCQGELHFRLGLLHPISTQLGSTPGLFPERSPVLASLSLHFLLALLFDHAFPILAFFAWILVPGNL